MQNESRNIFLFLCYPYFCAFISSNRVQTEYSYELDILQKKKVPEHGDDENKKNKDDR